MGFNSGFKGLTVDQVLCVPKFVVISGIWRNSDEKGKRSEFLVSNLH